MRCPNCRAENRDDSKFCSNCGRPLGPGAGAGPEGASVTRSLVIPAPLISKDALISAS